MKKQNPADKIVKTFLITALVALGGFSVGIDSVHAGITNITNTGVGGAGGFPVALAIAGETYQLTEDINCATTCFTVKASNITLDLNGHTATFGSANNPNLQNTGMESWADVNTLSNWTVLSGTVSQKSAEVWGDYDAELSEAASIKSDPVMLNAGQTYAYYSMIKGTSSDSYVISLRDATNNSVLATTAVSGDFLNRAFAMASGTLTTSPAEHEYKPSINQSAYLQIDCVGTATKRLHAADIKPVKHFFLTNSNYRNTAVYPDLSDNLFGGTAIGLAVRNGSINQGLGNGVKSIAIYASAISSIEDVDINMTGNNSSAMTLSSATFTVNNVNTDTASILNFNRMHPLSALAFSAASTGAIEVKYSTFLNDPEGLIAQSYNFGQEDDTHTTKIHHNVMRQKGQVTESYAIGLTGVSNVEIYENDINPFNGRGILLDATANRSGYLDGTKNVIIRNNVIQNIHDVITPEYNANALEAAGIRIRDWGSTDPIEGHRNLKIHDNNISGYVDLNSTHRTYGINITSMSNVTSADIYNNSINIGLNSQLSNDWQASAIVLQSADMSLGGSINIHNNELVGSQTIRFGGNDGSSVKNIKLFSNKISGSVAPIFYNGYQGPFVDNYIFCNQITNTGIAGYPIYFEDGMPDMADQWISNNQIINYNSNGWEVLLGKNYTSSVTSCNNGTLDIFGGGQIGSANDPCHDGFSGCYASAGLMSSDIIAPNSPVNLTVL